jgi:heme oxygenase (biliverdin-producing, ferredoxin)
VSEQMNGARGLASLLRERTAALHRQAQRCGVMRDIMRRQATPGGYKLLLRNLWPAYSELERGLDRLQERPGVGRFARPVLYRAPAIAKDLAALAGADWQARIPLLEAGRAYAAAVAEAAAGDGERLIAHAYTRYLGDLNGGQLIGAILSKAACIGPGRNAYFLFEAGEEPLERLRAEFKADLDRAGEEIISPAAVLEEAGRAFECNIALSRAVHEVGRAQAA